MFSATNEEIVQDLLDRTTYCLEAAKVFQTKSNSCLNQRANENSWSALECLEHLNRYGDFYLPEIAKSIANGGTSVSPQTSFRSSWLGQKMTVAMQPQGKGTKMKTFQSMNPIGSQLDEAVLNKFIEQQNKMLELLEKARQVNLQKNSTPTTLSKWIRLRLGDTLRLIVFHNQRHVEQAERAVGLYNS